MKTIRFVKSVNADNVYLSSTVTVTYQDKYNGATRTFDFVFRIDGRGDTYRVDRGSWSFWEAIDGGKGFDTLAAAKKCVKAYCEAVIAQGTTCPNLRSAAA